MVSVSQPIVPAMLPVRCHLFGPVTRRRLVRLGAAYGVLFLLGTAIAHAGDSAAWHALGLGLLLPGGGFLLHADVESAMGMTHAALAAGAMLLFLAAAVLWLATGNVLAPPLAWLLAAVAAALMGHDDTHHHTGPDAGTWVPLLIALLLAGAFAGAFIRRGLGVRARRRANRYLETAGREAACSFRHAEAALPEYTPDDLRRMRFLLDRALQSVGAFEGFEWLDQFQTAAVRYQLNFTGYALAMAQATHLPAFGGYLNTAQQRLIAKLADHRMWRYWELESLWGKLRRETDPIASHDNIMFGGFGAAQMALFHAASGGRDYDAPGSFTLRHPSGEMYAYDAPALIRALGRAFDDSDFCLTACEPNWIYPLCNAIGAVALKAHDPRRWRKHEARFRQQLESEFIDLSGRLIPARSALTGLALPPAGGAVPQAMASYFLNATLPDIALRQWLLLRRGLFGATGRLNRRQFWPVDTGNYRFSRAAAYSGTALAATEMGDGDVATHCLAALEEECTAATAGGVMHRPAASVWAHAVEFLARSGAANGLRTLVERPRSTGPQPEISARPYPDVLVARAVSEHGGLNAVLYPGRRPGVFRMGLSGLVPGRAYRCDGAEPRRIVADARGGAVIEMTLAGRTEVRLYPSP